MNQAHLLKVSRLECLSDGVFAIAMTILAFDLRLPKNISATRLTEVLTSDILSSLLVYGISFIILGTLWIGMNFQLGIVKQLNRTYLWTHVFYLMIICVVPFSASLVAHHDQSQSAITFYVINLICASLMQIITMQCAHYYKLTNESYTDSIRHAVIRRVLVAPPFYALALVLAFWNTRLAFIILIVPTLLYMLPGKVDNFNKS